MSLNSLLVFTISFLFAFQAFSQGTADRSCRTVTESDPPFLITAASGDNSSIQRQMSNGTGARVEGYFPVGTIVRVNPASMLERANPLAHLSVRVLSVPDETVDFRFTYRRNNFRTLREGTGQRAQVGMTGYVAATDLWVNPFARTENPDETIFQVRRNSPRLNIPGLEGKPIRLARHSVGFSDYYLTKKCCSAGHERRNAGFGDIIPGIESMVTNRQYPHESTRDPQCTYSPVFEILRNTATAGQDPNFVVDRQFSTEAGSCENCQMEELVESLQPISPDNFRTVFNVNNTAQRLTRADLDIIQQRAWREAIENRPGRGSGNESKGLCAQAVRQTLQGLGLLPSEAELQRTGGRPGKARGYADGDWLGSRGFTNVTGVYGCDPNAAPEGSVIVYTTPGDRNHPGHIEIKVGEDGFCSDYCSNNPINENPNLNRRCSAVYMPNRRPNQ